ncbi:uncharacterized protein UV8b_06193 [Ustilaginoidea virens]|uniref:Uncharacterized protein n=1 Tax=Ustilaginoidea virens TaxID=1159556 RepID=A0A8E5MJT2_USTVR|nr:uncharacterized protein UV8b_06193 [Ustilaginoidea virens]QUC21952.1 hypothetical protein UV8b_06193 [Ustilaginoidea virens]
MIVQLLDHAVDQVAISVLLFQRHALVDRPTGTRLLSPAAYFCEELVAREVHAEVGATQRTATCCVARGDRCGLDADADAVRETQKGRHEQQAEQREDVGLQRCRGRGEAKDHPEGFDQRHRSTKD